MAFILMQPLVATVWDCLGLYDHWDLENIELFIHTGSKIFLSLHSAADFKEKILEEQNFSKSKIAWSQIAQPKRF